MPYIVVLVGVAIKFFAAYAVTRIIIALGLTYVVISGFEDLTGGMQADIIANYGQFPGAVYEIVTLAGADVAITILFSAITVRMIMNGLTQGVIGTMAFRGISSQAE